MVTLSVLTKIVTPAITLLTRQLILNVALLEKKMQKIRRDTLCNWKNIIYVGYCIKCMKQGVG